MTTELHSLARIAVTEESAGASFGTDLTGSATYLDVPAVEGSIQLTLTRTQLEANPVQQRRVEYAQTVLGVKRWSLTFRMVLAPTNSAATAGGSSATAATNAQSQILKTLLGGIRGGNLNGTTIAGSTTSSIVLTTGHGARFTAGGAIGVTTPGGSHQLREIESIATDTLTLKHALSTAPGNGVVVQNCATYYPTEDPATTLQFIAEGVETENRWLLMGGFGGITLETPVNGELPAINVTLEGVNWTTLGAQAITVASYPSWEPVMGVGEFLAQVVATVTRQITQVSALEYALTMGHVMVTSPDGVQAVKRMRATRGVPFCTVNFTQVWDQSGTPGGRDWNTARDNRHRYHLAYQIGTAERLAMLVTAPSAQITDFQFVDNEGVASNTVEARARMDNDATDQTTEIRRAPFRIHVE